VVAPARRITRKFRTNAIPVPRAPSTATLVTTAPERFAGFGGGPATSGPSTASCAVAISSRPAAIAMLSCGLRARNLRWYGIAKLKHTTAAKQVSCPSRLAPVGTRHTPRMTSTPAKPTSRPTARRGTNCSVRNTRAATGRVSSGVVAFQIPATNEGMRCSAYPNKVNGTTTPSVAATARCPQVRRSWGSRRRVTASSTDRVAAPMAARPKVTYTGGSSRTPTLISRKLAPQMVASTR
jgi:hypothetical protein